MTTLLLTAALLFHTDTELSHWYEEWQTAPTWRHVAELVHPHLAAAVSSPEPPAAAPSTGVEQWRTMVAHFPGWNVDRMLRIMRCESRGDPNAYNSKTGVAGLFQIHPLWQKVWPGDYYDPWTNAAVAYQVWLEQGYRAWVCRG